MGADPKLMVETYLTFLSKEGSRYPRARTILSGSRPEYWTGLLSSRPDGKNGPTLPIIHVYYIIVHVHPRKTGPWPWVSARAYGACPLGKTGPRSALYSYSYTTPPIMHDTAPRHTEHIITDRERLYAGAAGTYLAVDT